MKVYICLVVILSFSSTLRSQIVKTEFYDSLWNITIESNCVYKRIIDKESDSLYRITDYNKDNSTEMIGTYSSIDPLIENGCFEFYTSKGILWSQGEYKDGAMCCIWDNFDSTGKITSSVDYSFVEKKCIWTYKQAIEDTSLAEFGGHFVHFAEMAHFGEYGMDSFSKYIIDNLYFPPMMIKYSVEEKIFMRFTVDTQGNVCDIKNVRGNSKDFISEVRRVLSSSPQWIPGDNNQTFTIPIKFTLID